MRRGAAAELSMGGPAKTVLASTLKNDAGGDFTIDGSSRCGWPYRREEEKKANALRELATDSFTSGRGFQTLCHSVR
jgi:hypothetical protein